ncbi:hypothetical protein TNCT_89111 [Trichonephila clavata]|uniref:Pre-C2HC domain-containing protein n=1 Tax=Trichonephila clavata TaxID=2740835 RepID=A0A8X6FYR8_TRICU|nr:hypothetical protein TNCT_89111 [Trichonephila clavata]
MTIRFDWEKVPKTVNMSGTNNCEETAVVEIETENDSMDEGTPDTQTTTAEQQCQNLSHLFAQARSKSNTMTYLKAEIELHEKFPIYQPAGLEQLKDNLKTAEREHQALLVASRPIKVVIKGLPASTPVDDIEQDLKNQGVAVQKVVQLRKFQTQTPLPIFMVEVNRAENATDIHEVKVVDGLKFLGTYSDRDQQPRHVGCVVVGWTIAMPTRGNAPISLVELTRLCQCGRQSSSPLGQTRIGAECYVANIDLQCQPDI